ncbi:MAG: Na+/H+ antiporter NhaC family protein [Clostridia bacterium]|nr:Na+/H+ antiporter NhaC family protein [Clostridia bacterium]
MAFLRKNKSLIALAVAVVVVAVLAVVNFTGGEDFTFANSLWAILPPVVAIGLALITKEVYSSLFVGILVGALMSSKFSFSGTMDTVVNDGLISAVSDTAGIFIFLVILGAIVALVNKTGASAAFGHWAEKNIKTKTGAMLATFALGVLIFIDDYFNCLTVGAVMSPVTDSHKISRVKLAYIIDATAAPVCMIAPVSSWAAAVSSYVESETYSGIELFIRAIPFNFYSLMTLVFVIGLSIMGYDYGKMSEFAIQAQNGELGELHTASVEEEAPVQTKKVHVFDLLIPVIVLVVACIGGLLYVGGFFDGVDFVTAFADTDATVGLPWGALIALVLIIAYLIIRRLVSFADSMKCIPQGFIAMVPAILILTFATGLKNVTGLLDIDTFVETSMKAFPEDLAAFLPAVIFLVACVLAFATGTSWGTFGILIPIVLAVFPEGHELLFVGISACLAGAVCGDHCSPISDTTIMASAGANCNHVDHVSTQLPYAITVAAISFVSFILAGFVPNAWICLAFSIALTIGTLVVIKLIVKKKAI